MESWPFADSPNTASITTRQVLEGAPTRTSARAWVVWVVPIARVTFDRCWVVLGEVYALARAFHCANRSEISPARFRSSGPSITPMSSGSARQYTPAVRALTSGSFAARVVQ